MAMLPVLPIGPITMDGPLPNMRCRSMHTSEGLGRCFSYQVDVAIQQVIVTATDLLGKSVTVHWTSLATESPRIRHFNGIVSAIEYQGYDDTHSSHFRLTLRPWFWFLNKSVNCRIFPNVSVIDILTLLFDGEEDYQGFAVWNRDGLKGEHARKREYVVQYRESDFNFVQRLLESEGISYFFHQEADKHTMMLVDTFLSDPKAPEVPFFGPDDHRTQTIEYVSQWNVLNEVQPGTFTHTDFDFQNPAAPITSTTTIARTYDHDALEVYDYPGDFPPKIPATDGLDEQDPGPFGAPYSALRVQQLQLPFAAAHAACNALVIGVGGTFKLVGHLREDLNQEYLVVSADCILSPTSDTSGDSASGPTFFCNFVAMDLKTPFRPPMTVAKPVVRGPHTATVTTKGDDEITSDPYGRVYVRFHWDRDPDRTDWTSSCPVRVSQVWAGTGFGAVFTPRVGQEVIVDFLEGDPDKPIIVGRVHNKLNMPPYDPAKHPTRSGIRSRSSPGGTQVNFNEIRFEDKKGHEELYLQAERTQTTLVKGSQSITVGGDRAVTVTGKETYTVKKSRTTDITEDDVLKVHGNVGHTFDKMYETTVGDSQATTVKNDYLVKTTDGQIVITHGKSEFSITQSEDTWIDTANAHIKLEPGGNIEAGNNKALVTMDSGGAILVTASAADITIKRDSTTIVVTSDKISITADSMVQVKAKTVNIDADTTVHAAVNGSKIELSSSKASVACGSATAELTASGVAVTGPMIKLNS